MSNPDLRKAAIVLMSMPADEAAAVIGKLSPKQVEAVSIEIASISSVTGVEQEAAIHEFAAENPASLGAESGGLDRAQNLVEKALGKNAPATLEKVRQQIEALPFSFLNNVDSQNLVTFIADEHPQTIALVLSHLKPARSAEIIAGLPPERQLAVIRRIATMGQTNPEVVAEVERGLEKRMANCMSQDFENAGGVAAVAEMLNVTDRATERSLMENLAQEDPDLVEDIRRLMFIFEDLTKLSDRDIQAVLKEVETSQWAMALKGSSEELKEKVLGNLSSRASDLLREEMDYLGPVKLSEVEKVQQQIVDIIRRLEDAGEITVHGEDDDEHLIQ